MAGARRMKPEPACGGVGLSRFRYGQIGTGFCGDIFFVFRSMICAIPER
jgi:hypothetical protein